MDTILGYVSPFWGGVLRTINLSDLHLHCDREIPLDFGGIRELVTNLFLEPSCLYLRLPWILM